MTFRGEFHSAVIVAGDGDFGEAIKQIKKTWKKVYVAGYASSMSKDLVALADNVYYL